MTTFDDIDARPGSVASRLRTLVGLYLRRLDGWISTADLVRLMADLGVGDAQARTGIARLKAAKLLLAERRDAPGYRLNRDAEAMLARGDRRIFDSHPMSPDEAWCVVSFSIPETQRAVRTQLRRRLEWLGCGIVAPALWINRGAAEAEIDLTLHELGVRQHATLFLTERPQVSGSLADAVARWWNLGALELEHSTFLAALATQAERDAFRRYVDGIDAWRVVPYTDPHLSPLLLPAGWIGQRSSEALRALRAKCEDAAWTHVLGATARG